MTVTKTVTPGMDGDDESPGATTDGGSTGGACTTQGSTEPVLTWSDDEAKDRFVIQAVTLAGCWKDFQIKAGSFGRVRLNGDASNTNGDRLQTYYQPLSATGTTKVGDFLDICTDGGDPNVNVFLFHIPSDDNAHVYTFGSTTACA